jgi:hypothetical protein
MELNTQYWHEHADGRLEEYATLQELLEVGDFCNSRVRIEVCGFVKHLNLGDDIMHPNNYQG